VRRPPIQYRQFATASIDLPEPWCSETRIGSRVAVLERNCHRYLESYLAAARNGSVLVPLNYRLASRELARSWSTVRPSAARGAGFLSLVEAIADTPTLKQIVCWMVKLAAELRVRDVTPRRGWSITQC